MISALQFRGKALFPHSRHFWTSLCWVLPLPSSVDVIVPQLGWLGCGRSTEKILKIQLKRFKIAVKSLKEQLLCDRHCRAAAQDTFLEENGADFQFFPQSGYVSHTLRKLFLPLLMNGNEEREELCWFSELCSRWTASEQLPKLHLI